MGFPTLFGIFVVFILWFTYQRKKNDAGKETKDFWEEESKANSIRRKNIDSLDYVKIDLDNFLFPDLDDPIFKDCHKKLKFLSEKKILNLTGITNTELKLLYGSPNLNLLSECDENFTLLVRTLHILGKHLLETSYREEAIKTLEFAIDIKSDVSESYRLLCSLYRENGDLEKIEKLRSTAESLNSLNKKTIINYLCTTK